MHFVMSFAFPVAYYFFLLRISFSVSSISSCICSLILYFYFFPSFFPSHIFFIFLFVHPFIYFSFYSVFLPSGLSLFLLFLLFCLKFFTMCLNTPVLLLPLKQTQINLLSAVTHPGVSRPEI